MHYGVVALKIGDMKKQRKHRPERNWSQYNQKLKQIARIDFFISEDAIKNWCYTGTRKPGGKIIYSDHVIEMCLTIRERYKFAYRQAQGFIESVMQYIGIEVVTPDYSTMSRRCGKLKISLRSKLLKFRSQEKLVVAVDATGLSLYSGREWNRIKHQSEKTGPLTKWRKLHLAIDVKSGEILSSAYSKATVNDGEVMPSLLAAIDAEIEAVCGDMAYDKINCRDAIRQRGARQLIPPSRNAREARDNRNMTKKREILKERDDAIKYIKHNKINGDAALARASWKRKAGYHIRSLIEATMLQIKQHGSDRLTNRKEQNRIVQAQIKCKLVNIITTA